MMIRSATTDAAPAPAAQADEPCDAAAPASATEGGENLADTTAMLHAIDQGRLNPDDLPLEDRRACVESLTHQGFTNSEIAQVMRVSERTIRRDRVSLRKEGGIKPSLTLSDDLLGEYHRLTLASTQRLSRLANDPGIPPYARLWAEDAISRCYHRFMQTADKLEYLEHGHGRRHRLRNEAEANGPRHVLPPLPVFPRPSQDEIKQILEALEDEM